MSFALGAAVSAGLALLLAALEFLATRYVSARLLQRRITGFFIRSRLLPTRALVMRVQMAKQRDNLDWQLQGDFIHGVSPKTTARRIRWYFEAYKTEIATRRRQPSLLFLDAGSHPGQQFYPLVEHVGRTQLRAMLHVDPTDRNGSEAWDGRERRRLRGSISDREVASGAGQRIYDDPHTIALISSGIRPASNVRESAAVTLQRKTPRNDRSPPHTLPTIHDKTIDRVDDGVQPRWRRWWLWFGLRLLAPLAIMSLIVTLIGIMGINKPIVRATASGDLLLFGLLLVLGVASDTILDRDMGTQRWTKGLAWTGVILAILLAISYGAIKVRTLSVGVPITESDPELPTSESLASFCLVAALVAVLWSVVASLTVLIFARESELSASRGDR
jgi:hypothetical protein